MCWEGRGQGHAGCWLVVSAVPRHQVQAIATIPLGEDADLVNFKVPAGRIGRVAALGSGYWEVSGLGDTHSSSQRWLPNCFTVNS